jgi:hypothetical protein
MAWTLFYMPLTQKEATCIHKVSLSKGGFNICSSYALYEVIVLPAQTVNGRGVKPCHRISK